MSRKRRKNWGPPQEFNDDALCYFMGLCSGLVVMDEKARDRGTWKLETRTKKVYDGDGTLIDFQEELTGLVLPDVDAIELCWYTQKIGDRYIHALKQERQRSAVELNGSK
jgi:hypothetical protein